MKQLAQQNLGTLEGLGPLGEFTKSVGQDGSSAFALFLSTISTGLGVLTVAGAIWFIIQLGAGSFQWLSSGGEKQALQNAQKRITNAIVGLFVIIFSYALIGIVGLIFGINILAPFGWLPQFSDNYGPAGGTLNDLCQRFPSISVCQPSSNSTPLPPSGGSLQDLCRRFPSMTGCQP